MAPVSFGDVSLRQFFFLCFFFLSFFFSVCLFVLVTIRTVLISFVLAYKTVEIRPELCESRGGRFEFPVPNKPTVSVDVKQQTNGTHTTARTPAQRQSIQRPEEKKCVTILHKGDFVFRK